MFWTYTDVRSFFCGNTCFFRVISQCDTNTWLKEIADEVTAFPPNLYSKRWVLSCFSTFLHLFFPKAWVHYITSCYVRTSQPKNLLQIQQFNNLYDPISMLFEFCWQLNLYLSTQLLRQYFQPSKIHHLLMYFCQRIQ